MGAVGSHLTRHIRRFNVVDRTERVISQEKPTPAPLHKADAERLKNLKDDPQVLDEIKNRNSMLEKNLQSVYVTSKGDLPDGYVKSKGKLPQNREQVFNSGFMFEEPEHIPVGRYTLTQITECIADYNKDKQMYTAEVLANRINVDKKIMENILKYYRVFDMYIPQKMMEQKKHSKLSIGNAISKIRLSLEMDKFKEERKLLNKNENSIKKSDS